MITAEVQKGHIYYRCTKKKGACSQPYAREEVLLSQIDEVLAEHAMSSPWQKEFEKLIAEDERDSSKETAASVQALREEVHTLSRKIDRLTDLYIAQDIEREDYLKRRRALVLERKSVEERIALLERDAGYWLEPMRTWVNDASLLDEAAKSKDIPSKKSSLRKIFGSNLHLEKRIVQETAPFPYAALRAARQKYSSNETSFIRAAGLGFEPRYSPPKGDVLPLDDPAIWRVIKLSDSGHLDERCTVL